jgi:hypothetical protein
MAGAALVCAASLLLLLLLRQCLWSLVLVSVCLLIVLLPAGLPTSSCKNAQGAALARDAPLLLLLLLPPGQCFWSQVLVSVCLLGLLLPAAAAAAA